MKKIVLIVLMMLASFTINAIEKGYTLTWDANTETDLKGYKVYVGTVSGQYTKVAELGKITSYNGVINVPDDKLTNIYAVVTAFDNDLLESDYSNEVTAKYDTRIPPSPPKNLKWYDRLLSWIKGHWKFWA